MESSSEWTHKIMLENTAMGMPRSLVSQISAMVPPTLVMGADEAMPAIWRKLLSLPGGLTKRPASMVPILGARHEGRVKIK